MSILATKNTKDTKVRMTAFQSNEICDIMRQTAYDIHVYFGTGYLEKVYENALAHRLSLKGMSVEQQVPVKVRDVDGFVVGDYIVDMMVDGVVVELKAVESLHPVHVAQTLNYLKATGSKYAMLINFGASKFQCRKLAL